MDRNASDDLNKPLLLSQDSSYDENEFHDAVYTPTSSMNAPSSTLIASLTHPPQKQQHSPQETATSTNATTNTTTTSYYGKVSPLATGMLFPSSRGIVDTLPHPTKPCLLFADHDPLAAVSHICLLEKEAESLGGVALPLNPQLFTVVHVCEPLAKHDDAGTRILKKINKSNELELPVLFHEGNIFQEGKAHEINCEGRWGSSFACLIPEYIDGAIGKKNLLRPDDPVGLYNMKLFIQRHSHLPALFYKILSHPSVTQRIQHSTQLLNLLKLINTDLQTFDDGPYLCGTQFTLADIYIFPIIERIVVVLSVYRNFWIPPSLVHLIHWYDTVAERPAVRVATADRTVESQNTYCYERVQRNQYLIEVYECYARHEERLFRELNDESGGGPGVNVYRQEVQEDMRDGGSRICERRMSICEKQNCVIS